MPHLGVAPGAQTGRNSRPNLNFLFRLRQVQSLFVGVNNNEFHAGKTGLDHAINRVGAAAANADHFDDGVTAGPVDSHANWDSPE
jgi:hypothetical protein